MILIAVRTGRFLGFELGFEVAVRNECRLQRRLLPPNLERTLGRHLQCLHRQQRAHHRRLRWRRHSQKAQSTFRSEIDLLHVMEI
jgi:hypothetical protein